MYILYTSVQRTTKLKKKGNWYRLCTKMKLSEQMFFVAEVNHSSTSFYSKKLTYMYQHFLVDHLLLVTSPATENTCSAGTDVAGTHKYFLASFAKLGKLLLLWLHHSKILPCDFKGAIFKYSSNSSANELFLLRLLSSSSSPVEISNAVFFFFLGWCWLDWFLYYLTIFIRHIREQFFFKSRVCFSFNSFSQEL